MLGVPIYTITLYTLTEMLGELKEDLRIQKRQAFPPS